jgi:hypothetical protein
MESTLSKGIMNIADDDGRFRRFRISGTGSVAKW